MSSDEGIIDPNLPKKRKKGLKQVVYKSEKIKRARVKGEEYKNYKGNTVESRKMGEPCRCKKKCFLKVPEGDRLEIFKKIHDFETKNQQDAYLQGLIQVVDIKRRRSRTNRTVEKRHSHFYKYCVSSSSGKFDVCKQAFISLHGITPDRVRRLYNLLAMGKPPLDRRGKTTPGHAISGAVVQQVEEHIRSFPVKNAHYTGREFQYLSEKLDIKKMHQLFHEKHPQSPVKYSFYRKIFKERFSLSFGRPQVDTCCTCEELSVKINSKSLNETAKRVAVAEKIVHQRRAKKFFSKMNYIKELCQNEETVGAFCIDYMQNLALPTIPVQDTFYLHQLTVNVFNIHDLKSNQSFFYIYHEGLGKKGPNEVCSFVMDYISREISPQIKHLHIFSDGCGGQNKNHSVIRMCMSLVDLGRFESVNQYFPIRGHSYMPCDRDFAVVKRKIRKTDRVFQLKEFAELIIMSSAKNHFSVFLMDTENNIIKDYKSWWPKYYKKICLSTDSYGRGIPKDKKVSFNISRFMQFTHTRDRRGYVVASDYIDGLQTHEFKLSTSVIIQGYPDTPAYPQVKVPINLKKMISIRKFSRYIEHQHEEIQNFYKDIFNWPTVGGPEENPILE